MLKAAVLSTLAVSTSALTQKESRAAAANALHDVIHHKFEEVVDAFHHHPVNLASSVKTLNTQGISKSSSARALRGKGGKGKGKDKDSDGDEDSGSRKYIEMGYGFCAGMTDFMGNVLTEEQYMSIFSFAVNVCWDWIDSDGKPNSSRVAFAEPSTFTLQNFLSHGCIDENYVSGADEDVTGSVTMDGLVVVNGGCTEWEGYGIVSRVTDSPTTTLGVPAIKEFIYEDANNCGSSNFVDATLDQTGFWVPEDSSGGVVIPGYFQHFCFSDSDPTFWYEYDTTGCGESESLTLKKYSDETCTTLDTTEVLPPEICLFDYQTFVDGILSGEGGNLDYGSKSCEHLAA